MLSSASGEERMERSEEDRERMMAALEGLFGDEGGMLRPDREKGRQRDVRGVRR